MKRVWLVTIGASLLSPPLLAAPSEAEALFQQGRELMLEQRFEEACPKFEQSQKLEPRLGTLLNLAVCHEQEGKLASAWHEYREASAQARADGDGERERLAEERLSALADKVPRLVLEVPEPERARAIELDGSPLPRELWGTELRVDPGSHHVVVTLPEGGLVRRRFELAVGARQVFQLPFGERRKPPPAPAPAPAATEPEAAPAAAPSRRRGPWVLELGLFLGPALAEYEFPRPPSEAAIPVRERATGALRTCADVSCSYSLDPRLGVTLGVHALAGYAVSQEVLLGARLLAGPRIGGGTLFMVGPTAALRATEQVWLGASALLGDLTSKSDGEMVPPAEYERVSSERHELEAGLGGGLGAMLHADLILHEAERGSILASAMPAVLFGPQGSAYVVPVSLGYRFW